MLAFKPSAYEHLGKIYELSPLALGNNALDFVEFAVRAGNTLFHNITSDLSVSAALTSFGSSSLDRPSICVDMEACRARASFWRC